MSPPALMSPSPLRRPPQDISLEEFDDEDLSEITDDCGIGLNYDSDHYEKVQEERSVPSAPGDTAPAQSCGGDRAAASAPQSPSRSGGRRGPRAGAPRGCTAGFRAREPPKPWPGTPGPPTTSG